jgi:hypothetical protein
MGLALASREDLAWLAGLYEGEGSTSASVAHQKNTTPMLSVTINMTDLDVLERAQRVAGMGKIYGPYQRGTNKPHWMFKVQRQAHAYALLAALWPWLGMRRRGQVAANLLTWSTAPRLPRNRNRSRDSVGRFV